MDIQFAKYLILITMMIIGVIPALFTYLSAETKKSYGYAKTWMFWWWLLPVYKMVAFILNN